MNHTQSNKSQQIITTHLQQSQHLSNHIVPPKIRHMFGLNQYQIHLNPQNTVQKHQQPLHTPKRVLTHRKQQHIYQYHLLTKVVIISFIIFTILLGTDYITKKKYQKNKFLLKQYNCQLQFKLNNCFEPLSAIEDKCKQWQNCMNITFEQFFSITQAIVQILGTIIQQISGIIIKTPIGALAVFVVIILLIILIGRAGSNKFVYQNKVQQF